MSTASQRKAAAKVMEHVNAKVSKKNAETVYVDSAGNKHFIGEMHPTHAKNALAKIVQQLRAGKILKWDSFNGVIESYKPE